VIIGGSLGPSLLAPADSARAVAAVYTLSVLATLPLILAVVATAALRRASAESRLLVWRSSVLVLMLAFVGRFAAPSLTWVVPSPLAAPLIALGRVQITAAPLRSFVGAEAGLSIASRAGGLVDAIFVVYLGGVIVVLWSTIVASARLRRIAGNAGVAGDDACMLADVRRALGIRRPVRLLISSEAHVPMTWGFLRPVVVFPAGALGWSRSERRLALFHELAHVRTGDWAFIVAARFVCALYWFHPGVWWIARGLRHDCELACDDRVLNAGARRSDYAELLCKVAAALQPPDVPAVAELAFARRVGLRVRLDAVLDTGHAVRPLARGWAAPAMLVTLAAAGAMATVRITPSRAVLTTLMQDVRWESRAYAVVGLAQRADSIAVARSAAERDPSPRVRAWARYALGEPNAPRDLRAILHD
jgi:beta-lactamase regulating signal transducer with metallopeptidase domain